MTLLPQAPGEHLYVHFNVDVPRTSPTQPRGLGRDTAQRGDPGFISHCTKGKAALCFHFNCVSVSQGSRLLPLSPHKGKMCAKMLPVFHCQLGRVLRVKLIKAACGTKPCSLQEWKQSCFSILVLSGLKWKSGCRAQSVQRQNLKEGRQPHLAV